VTALDKNDLENELDHSKPPVPGVGIIEAGAREIGTGKNPEMRADVELSSGGRQVPRERRPSHMISLQSVLPQLMVISVCLSNVRHIFRAG
jgi:hypothetical protein